MNIFTPPRHATIDIITPFDIADSLLHTALLLMLRRQDKDIRITILITMKAMA